MIIFDLPSFFLRLSNYRKTNYSLAKLCEVRCYGTADRAGFDNVLDVKIENIGIEINKPRVALIFRSQENGTVKFELIGEINVWKKGMVETYSLRSSTINPAYNTMLDPHPGAKVSLLLEGNGKQIKEFHLSKKYKTRINNWLREHKKYGENASRWRNLELSRSL